MHDPTGRRCAASQLCVENEPFTLSSKASDFSQNGRGYSLFFKIIKFGFFGLGLSLLPLALIMMMLFRSGNDCTAKYGQNASTYFENGDESAPQSSLENSINNPELVFASREGAQNATVADHKFRFDNLGDDITGISEAFNPVTGVSSFFETTIHGLSHNYIQRYFKKICEHKEKADAAQNHYRNFCTQY